MTSSYWIALFAISLMGCGARGACEATGGEWSSCGGPQQFECVDGEVIEAEAVIAVCEVGCVCPSDAKVWDPQRGCLTESEFESP